MCTIRLNIKYIYILPSQYIYIFNSIIKINSKLSLKNINQAAFVN
jgi:hypothetical protein